MRRRSRPLKVVHFDCEARPLGWYAGDQTHKEITVIAWHNGSLEAKALTSDQRSRRRMLRAFAEVYESADIVIGHYIRKFDLPLFNAMLAEEGEPKLSAKLTSDTFLDLPKLHGISKSQENLADMFGVTEEKVHMTVPAWREANRLTKDGIEGGKRRAMYDVAQNLALYEALVERGLLGPPRVWRP